MFGKLYTETNNKYPIIDSYHYSFDFVHLIHYSLLSIVILCLFFFLNKKF